MLPELAVKVGGNDVPAKVPKKSPKSLVPSNTVTLSQQDSVSNEVKFNVTEVAPTGEMVQLQDKSSVYSEFPLPSLTVPLQVVSKVLP